MSFRATGKLPSGSLKKRLQGSANFKENGFVNTSPTPMLAEGGSYWKMAKNFFRKDRNATPPRALPFIKTDLSQLSEAASITWFGHSSYLLHIDGKNILVDPVFSGHAAPLSFMIRAFPGSNTYSAADMPLIDYLVLTHDHYDHLDYSTILRLKKKVKRIYCSLGLSAHLTYWGVDPAVIIEMDWWEEQQLDSQLALIATPARHFSGRGIKRSQTLWSSFVLMTPSLKIYIGGDSGYDTHFKKIGDMYGPFDLAILEAGQYNLMWPLIHMMPEQTVQAAVDLKARTLLPVHWGKFSLAMHAWNEPVKRVLAKAKELGVDVRTPKIGEPLLLGEPYKGDTWWDM